MHAAKPICESVNDLRRTRQGVWRRSCRLSAFDMTRKPVQYRFPAVTLQFNRMIILCIKGLAHCDGVIPVDELDDHAAITHRITDKFERHYARKGASEIKTGAALLRLHAGSKVATFLQVNRGTGGMPVIGRGVPLHYVFRRRPRSPDLLQRCMDSGLYGDFHPQVPPWVQVRLSATTRGRRCWRNAIQSMARPAISNMGTTDRFTIR